MGDTVSKHPGTVETTKVVAKHKDLWDNEAWITEFHLEDHIKRNLVRKVGAKTASKVLHNIESFLKDPLAVWLDKQEGALIYVKLIDGVMYCLVVGKDTGKIFTIYPTDGILKEGKRFKLIYRK